jgi:hypothetical protein
MSWCLDTGFILHLQQWSALAPRRVRGTSNEQQPCVIWAATQKDFSAHANRFCDFAFSKKLVFSLPSIGSRWSVSKYSLLQRRGGGNIKKQPHTIPQPLHLYLLRSHASPSRNPLYFVTCSCKLMAVGALHMGTSYTDLGFAFFCPLWFGLETILKPVRHRSRSECRDNMNTVLQGLNAFNIWHLRRLKCVS